MAALAFTIRPLTAAAPLSKSRFVHGMQCPLYVWLEVRTDAPRAEVDAFTKALFATGDEVGEQARLRWDRRLAAEGKSPGLLMSDDPRRHDETVAETQAALAAGATVIHEAAFTHGGVKVRVDVLERLADGTFAIHEVKSTSKYDEKKHLLDAAVQLWAVRGAGLEVSRVTLVHLNGLYEWPGGAYDLKQLFAEEDVTDAAEALQEVIGLDVARLLRVLGSDGRPPVPDGTACGKPYACPYGEVCPSLGPAVEHPVEELPGRTDAVAARARSAGCASLLELDEVQALGLLTYSDGRPHEVWFNTWKATRSRERIVLDDLAHWIDGLERPVRHLDFETLGCALPVVAHTRPFQVVPLQYSVHVEGKDGATEHLEFMADADDPDPRRTLLVRLLEDLGGEGAIIHWSSYEKTVIEKAARDPRYAELRPGLEALVPRLRDLGMAVNHWVFDGGFHGKWSLKKVYPVLVPGADASTIDEGSGIVSYDDLDGVAKGDEAAMLLLEYMRPTTAAERRAEIRRQLLQYCQLDTWATVEVLRVLREGHC
jgi:hypothetical protein